jgi:hypothetical protein
MSRARQKGTAFETSLLDAWRPWHPDVTRTPLAGARDIGDLRWNGQLYVVEAKNCAATTLAAWAAEAAVEAEHAGLEHWVIAHKRRGVSAPGQQWVTTTVDNFLALVNRDRTRHVSELTDVEYDTLLAKLGVRRASDVTT